MVHVKCAVSLLRLQQFCLCLSNVGLTIASTHTETCMGNVSLTYNVIATHAFSRCLLLPSWVLSEVAFDHSAASGAPFLRTYQIWCIYFDPRPRYSIQIQSDGRWLISIPVPVWLQSRLQGFMAHLRNNFFIKIGQCVTELLRLDQS